MDDPGRAQKNLEQLFSQLRALYERYGYTYYQTSKFENYDLYAQNRSFLLGDQILAFTDADGRLMALKPDVTLSLVKNLRITADGGQKVYYKEHVYRTPGAGQGFQEITQMGLENIGPVDLYAMGEMVMLAVRSLQAISGNYLLDLSHMGVVDGLLAEQELPAPAAQAILGCIRQKNLHGLRRQCQAAGVRPALQECLEALAGLYGPFGQTIGQLRPLCLNGRMRQAVDELEGLYALLEQWGCGARVQLDFSIVNDLDYYNGVIFQGFVQGVASNVLAGGRYDRLLARFGKPGGAIGFAVYADLLKRLGEPECPYDVDVLLSYAPDCPPGRVAQAAEQLVRAGQSVRAQPAGQTQLRCRRRMHLDREGRLIHGTADA